MLIKANICGQPWFDESASNVSLSKIWNLLGRHLGIHNTFSGFLPALSLQTNDS